MCVPQGTHIYFLNFNSYFIIIHLRVRVKRVIITGVIGWCDMNHMIDAL